MKEDVLFKKTPFGGFDRMEVISYIQQLKETQQKYKVMIDEKDALNRKLAEDNVILSRQVETLSDAAKENDARLEEAEKQLQGIKAKYDMLVKKSEKAGKYDEAGKKLAGDTVKMCDELVETASVTAKEIVKQAEDELNGIREKIKGVVAEIDGAKNMPAKDIKNLLKKLSEELGNV
ncbi:MAG: hypothetical protein MJ168_03825 [Clostridia bacterium]|nr:hypothetical protein [Clostridia bacterium]